MGARLGDHAVVEHDDQVRVDDGGQAVGHHQRRAAPQSLGQGLLHQGLVLGVEMRGGLVEDDYGGVLEQHPGDGQPLLLAARQPVAPLSDHRVVAVGQGRDHVVDAGGAAGLHQPDVRGAGPGVAQVGGHRVVEQVRVLGDGADGGPQRRLGEVAHVGAVDQHSALRHVIQAGHQRHQRGLARARRTDHRHHPARVDVQIDAGQHLDGPRSAVVGVDRGRVRRSASPAGRR